MNNANQNTYGESAPDSAKPMIEKTPEKSSIVSLEGKLKKGLNSKVYRQSSSLAKKNSKLPLLRDETKDKIPLNMRLKKYRINREKTGQGLGALGLNPTNPNKKFNAGKLLVTSMRKLNLFKQLRQRSGNKKNTFDKRNLLREEAQGAKCLINPDGLFKKIWETLKFVLLLYLFLFLPLKVTFFVENDDQVQHIEIDSYYIIEKSIDCFYLIDLVLNFFTPVPDKYDWAVTHSRIAVLYLKGWFTLDLLTIIPFEELVHFRLAHTSYSRFSYGIKFLKFLRLLRLVKLLRLFKSFSLERSEGNLIIKYLYHYLQGTVLLLVLPNFLLIVFFIHIMACVWFSMTQDSEKNDSWLHLGHYQDDLISNKYVTSFYFVVQTFTTVGYGDIISTSSNEIFVRIAIILTGSILYYLFSGQIVDQRSQRAVLDQRRSKKLLQLKAINKKYNIDKTIIQHTIELIKKDKGKNKSNKNCDFSSLSKNELETLYYNKFVFKYHDTKLFSETIEDTDFVIKLGLACKKKTYQAGEIVYEKDLPAAMFFIIISGEVEVISNIHPDITLVRIRKGYFGEYELIENCNRKFTVRAATDLKICALDSFNFKKLFLSSSNKNQEPVTNPKEGSFSDKFIAISLARYEKLAEANTGLEKLFIRKLYWKEVFRDAKQNNCEAKILAKLGLDKRNVSRKGSLGSPTRGGRNNGAYTPITPRKRFSFFG